MSISLLSISLRCRFAVLIALLTIALLTVVVGPGSTWAGSLTVTQLGETAISASPTGVGFVDLAINPSASSGVRFVNVVCDLDGDTPTSSDWLVQNFPMPLAPDAFGGKGGGTFSYSFGLASQPSGGSFTVFSSFTAAPIVTPNTSTMTKTSGVPFALNDIDNLRDVPPGFSGSAANRGSSATSLDLPSAPLLTPQADGGAVRNDIPGIKQGKNECGPVAAAQSLLWLANAKGLQGLPGQAALIAALKAAMNWTPANGVTDANFFTGKQAIAKSLQKANAPNRVVVQKGGTSQGNGTFKFIQSQLNSGEDVELSLSFGDGTGHWVTVAGADVNGKTQQLYFKDPLTGGNTVDSYNLDGTTVTGYQYARKGVPVTIGIAVGESLSMVPLPTSFAMATVALVALVIFRLCGPYSARGR
jgi:hypothetical protein